MPFVSSKITTAQANMLKSSIGKIANFPPEPDRPMMIARIEPLAEPIGDKTHGLYAELGEDQGGLWVINGQPIRFTQDRLRQTQLTIGDRLAGFLQHLYSSLKEGEVLDLDDTFRRAEIRDRARAAMKAALIEDGYSDVKNVAVRFIKVADTEPPHITLAMRAMVEFRGCLFEISGPPSWDGKNSLFEDDEK